MEQASPTKIRYIKLGAKGRWEEALDRGILPWGMPDDPHDLPLAGDWEGLIEKYRMMHPARGTAAGYTNEAKAFYDQDPSVMWITFARGRMWWAFAEPELVWVGGDGMAEGTRYRKARDGWCSCDVTGARLSMERLSTKLTQLGGYRRTICSLSPEQQQMCLAYINVTADTEQLAVVQARAELERGIAALIRRLSWADFELLVDLMLARTGWQRVSSLGGGGKDVDLVVEQPFNGTRMAVQVKSSATQAVVDDYARRLRRRDPDERCMLVCHSPVGTLQPAPLDDRRQLELLLPDHLAQLCLTGGLVGWVLEHAS
jgi:hypothetical protein